MKLVRPAFKHLISYKAALAQGWGPDNTRPAACAREELEKIADDPFGFIDAMDNREAKNGPITLPDGSQLARLPGFRRWMWDGEFSGSISLRWQFGTSALPPHYLGHIGYSVVPWKEKRHYATQALGHMLKEAKAVGLEHVEIKTDLDNIGSQKVITNNGGVLLGEYQKVAAYGGGVGLKYRIGL